MPSTLIATMGLFWRADKIYWGAGSQAGRLLGVPSSKKTARPIDFREQVGIYVLYSEYTPIYVGQSGGKKQKLFTRLKQHRRDDLAERWDRFSWFGTRKVKYGSTLSGKGEAFRPTRQTVLNHIEGILIHAIEPPLNGQDGRFGPKVVRYLQVEDDRLEFDEKEKIEEILDELRRLRKKTS